MRTTSSFFVVIALSASLLAQGSTTGSRRTSRNRNTAVTSEDLRQLRDLLEKQQQQIDALRQQMESRDRQLQQTQQQLELALQQAAEAQSRAASATKASDEQKQSLAQVQSDVAGVKTVLTHSAATTQEEQKKFSELSGLVNRFRFTGDVRVRQEDFFFDHDLCPAGACNPRVRERIRVRLGIEGKLGEDFLGGLALATGAITDPTSTNETLTNVFERKTIALDRGYIVYQPQAHKWLQLTGGKFAYTWNRSSVTFDPDLNPEGFSEKLSFDLTGPVMKNFTLTGMQMLFNEDRLQHDSFAAGFQASGKLAVGSSITASPAFTLLNWRNTEVILNEAPSVTGGATPGPFAPNGMTNCTVTVGGASTFCSKFLYADVIVPVVVKTGWEKLPLNLTAEYLQNLRAADSLLFNSLTSAYDLAGDPQDKAYSLEIGMGQQKERGDVQFGYEFRRQEQDSVIASFNESDQRSPTNVLQHRAYFLYNFRKNVQGAYTLWVGRTLNTGLVNAARQPGILPTAKDPWLKRMQFDLIYKF